jgi:outer membrane protein W
MKRHWWLIGTLLAFPLLASADVYDRYHLGEAGTVSLGGFVAFPSGGDLEEENVTGGGQITYHFTRHLAVEFSVLQIKDEIDAAASVPGLETSGSLELDMVALALTARVHLPVGRRVVFYAGGGFGYYVFDVDKDARADATGSFFNQGAEADFDLDVDNEWGYHVMAGGQVMILPNVALFADVRRTYLDAEFAFEATATSVQGRELARIDRSSSGYDHDLVRVGLTFYY